MHWRRILPCKLTGLTCIGSHLSGLQTQSQHSSCEKVSKKSGVIEIRHCSRTKAAHSNLTSAGYALFLRPNVSSFVALLLSSQTSSPIRKRRGADFRRPRSDNAFEMS